MKKHILTLALVLVLAFSLSGCFLTQSDEEICKALVQGDLDMLYLNQYDDAFIKMIGDTSSGCSETYEEGIATEAEFFCLYFTIVNEDEGETYEKTVSEDTKNAICSLLKEIYKSAKYTVGEPVKGETSGDDSYTVPVTISPINVIDLAVDKVNNEEDCAFTRFLDQMESVDVAAMSDEEYSQYTQDYAMAWVDTIKEVMPEMGYLDEETLAVKVAKDSDGYFSIDDDDFLDLDDRVIDYP